MLEVIWKVIMITNFFIAGLLVFLQRREPRTVWAWLLVLFFMPWVGFVLYFLVGRDYFWDKKFRTKELRKEMQTRAYKQERDILDKGTLASEAYEYRDLILYNLRSGYAAYTGNNDIEVYTDGNVKFEELIKAIDKAEIYIFIQYYVIRNDDLFARICKHLVRKVEEGVEVRILYDSLGGGIVPGRVWKEIEKKGIITNEFYAPILKKVYLRVNYRNHRKIVVIDGKFGFVGGFNIGEEYLGKNKKFGYWRDTHLKITGGAVEGLLLRFILDWNYTAKEKMRAENYKPDDAVKEDYSGAGMQIVTSGPDAGYEQIRDNYLRLINKAKKNIYIQTPYFVPDEAVFNALKIAACSGIDVRLMIPCKPDHPFVYWASYSYVGELLRAGMRCYLYGNGFLHAKTVMVDGEVASVGTANMDIRSFRLNFEINAMIYDGRTVRKLEEIFLADMKKSVELTSHDYITRRLNIRIKEQVSRLLAPLL
ncbi:MAG: cardiolipin synthase [Lachnospiraceae bacterium]|nr:cardiolipin synthase [Lachnospiraceae bacterium]